MEPVGKDSTRHIIKMGLPEEKISESEKQVVLEELNEMLKLNNFYKEVEFEGVELSQGAIDYLNIGLKKLSGTNIYRFHRRLIESILTFRIKKMPILREIIEDAFSLVKFKYAFNFKNLVPRNVELVADPKHIFRILVNLIGNSAKFTGKKRACPYLCTKS